VFEFVEIGIQFHVLLEASVKHVLADVIYVFHDQAFFLSRNLAFVQFVLGPFEPTIHVRNPSDVGLVNKQHSCPGNGGWCRVL